MKNSHISWTVNIQLNKWNTKNQVEFTVNTGIFCEKVSAILNGELSTTFRIINNLSNRSTFHVKDSIKRNKKFNRSLV